MVKAEIVLVNNVYWIKVEIIKSSKLIIEQMGKVPNSRYNPATKLWSIPYTSLRDFERIVGNHLIVWQHQDIKVGGIDENKFSSSINTSSMLIEYDNKGNVTKSKGLKTIPFPFQVQGINCMTRRNFLLLSDDAGLGKTLQLIQSIAVLKHQGKVKKGLIICKASLLYNWRDEVHKHSDLKAVILAGSKIQRSKIASDLKYSNDWTFCIVSYETYRTDYISFKDSRQCDEYSIPIDFISCDEMHVCKNPESIIGNTIHYVNARYKYALTATPLPNSPLESYNYLKWGGVITMEYNKFKERYGVWGGHHNKQLVGYKNINELKGILQQHMLRRLKKDKLKELPDVLFKTIPIKMNPGQQQLYNAVKNKLKEELVDTSIDNLNNYLTKLIRLQQVSNCPALVESNEKSSKLEALYDMVDDLVEGGEKVIIFSKFESLIQIVKKELGKYNPAMITGDVKSIGKTREQAEKKAKTEEDINKLMTSERMKQVYKFQQDPTCKVFLGSSGACREGLTLTAATHVIFLDTEWAWDYVEQAYSRAHRIGQKNAVTVYFLSSIDTIDEKVLEVIHNKKGMSLYMLGLGMQKFINGILYN